MSARAKLIIWGAGGHAVVVADLVRRLKRHRLAGFLDDVNPERKGETFCDARILGGREALPKLWRQGVRQLIVAIGDNSARLQAAAVARELGFQLASLVSPSADVARGTEIGDGTVIASGVVVTPGVRLGGNVILNTSCSVDHDCRLGEGVHICPGVHLAGKVCIGRAAWVGLGSAVIEGIRIGEGAKIGAGAVVVRDIPAQVLAFGVPARVARKLTGK